MISAIFFDYFGVVASDAYWRNIRDLEAEAGREAHMAQLSLSVNTGKIGWSAFCSEVAADLGLSAQEVEARYSQHNLNRLVVALARTLKDRVPIIGLASNAHHEHLRPRLAATGLDALFDPIVLSSEVGAAKPDPAFFAAAVAAAGCAASEALLIDDNQWNVDGAKEFGMQALRFESVDVLKRDLSQIL